MKTILIIAGILFPVNTLISQSVNKPDSFEIIPLKSKSIGSNENVKIDINDFYGMHNGLIDRICDPVVLNSFGITLIGSNNKPNIGLKLDFRPLFVRYINGEILFRSNFNQLNIINLDLEAVQLFRKQPFSLISLMFEYNLYNLSALDYNRYQNYFIGVRYGISWLSIGLLMGQQYFLSESNIGYKIILNPWVQTKSNKGSNPYKPFANIGLDLSYWSKNLNYKVNINFFLNSSISLGIGYEEVHDLNELLMSLRYQFDY